MFPLQKILDIEALATNDHNNRYDESKKYLILQFVTDLCFIVNDIHKKRHKSCLSDIKCYNIRHVLDAIQHRNANTPNTSLNTRQEVNIF